MENRTRCASCVALCNMHQHVHLSGWVNKRRNLGGVIFLDLRDNTGLMQVVVAPDSACFTEAAQLTPESVITVTGQICERSNKNSKLATGAIELVADSITIHSIASELPIQINDASVSDNNKLQQRVLALRGEQLQRNIKMRSKVTHLIRSYLAGYDFIDIETPYLTRSTPEGARDFLVPARTNQGNFYALPQSPQLFKQMLMMSGFDRYYQIARCFRDEDLRADRQPEFTQVDIEVSFMTARQIMERVEDLVKHLFNSVLSLTLPNFPVMTYTDAMYYYGSDKPDLRLANFKFIDITAAFINSAFIDFNNIANNPNNRIVALRVPAIAGLSRKKIDELTSFAEKQGKHLAYIKVNDLVGALEGVAGSISSPLAKQLSACEITSILTQAQAEHGDILLICADANDKVNAVMGALRLKLGYEYPEAFNYVEGWKPLWVVDFPMFEYSEEQQRYVACHHPFTAPKPEHVELINSDPSKCLAQAYDLVLNGWEIGGGSIRIHSPDIQALVFNALGISHEEAQNKFGFLLDNLQYGTPPHGGLALGLDRLVAIMCGAESIRDVIAFPKSNSGQCLLTNAPNQVDIVQLAQLGIEVVKNV